MTLIKWYGNKRKIADQIWQNQPKDFDVFYDGFFGSGSVSFAAPEDQTILATDLNSYLVNFWLTVKDPDQRPNLLAMSEKWAAEYNQNPEQTFFKARETITVTENSCTKAALFHLINKTGFNGIFRTNQKGKVNTPWGKHLSYKPLSIEQLTEYSYKIRNIDLSAQAFDYRPTDKKQWIYVDPPYLAVNPAAYVGYGCPKFYYEDLYPTLLQAHMDGHYITLSHSANDEIRQLFWFLDKIVDIDHQYLSASKGTSRKQTVEQILSNFTND